MKLKFNFMKKNQVVVAVTALMLITAGYLNFTNEEQMQSIETQSLADSLDMAEIGDAKLVSSQPANDSDLVNENTINNTLKSGENIEKNSNIEKNNTNTVSNTNENTITEETSKKISSNDYFIKSRLERDTMYSQMIESYQKILEKNTISEVQKTTAQKEITKINEQKNAIMIVENLIKTKGFEELIIFINDKSINVIVKTNKLEKNQVAQIQNIVMRELKADIDDIHISTKK